MQRTPWIERRFTFDLPAGWMPNVLERLRGTPARIAAIISEQSPDVLRRRKGDAWSIQEHIGHLADLEELHEARIVEFLDHTPVLRAADMTNAATYEAHHNEADVRAILDRFNKDRTRLCHLLYGLDDETQLFTALHPRLQVMVRPVDIAYFFAEHDDHHLATIRELLYEFE